jgi:hypothetical protein
MVVGCLGIRKFCMLDLVYLSITMTVGAVRADRCSGTAGASFQIVKKLMQTRGDISTGKRRRRRLQLGS